MTRAPHINRGLAAVAAALLLGGCNTLSQNGGMDAVADLAGTELNKTVAAIRTPEEASAAREQVERLLKRTLSADDAVQIALLNNRGLQAAYNELGIAEAAKLKESLPPNPTVSVGRLSGPLEIEIEKKIVANILALATLPVRADIAKDRYRQAQLRAAEETMRIAAETRRAYYRVVASRSLIGFLDRAKTAAATAAKLGQRLGESGAINKIDQAREQVFYAEIAAQLATTRQKSASERERLTRLLGLWGGDLAFKLPRALPALPTKARSLRTVEIEAIRRRMDLLSARLEVSALAKTYGLTQATRFINLLEVAGIEKTVKEKMGGVEGETPAKVRDRGYELELQVPIFDFGTVRARQASETYLQAVNRLIEKAVNIRSEARDAYRAYRATYDVARHYRDEVLPLRKIISEETLLRYNAMQIDVFALLTEARQRVASNIAGIDAQLQFWLATVDLGVAVIGGGVSGGGADGQVMASAAPGGAAEH